MRKVAVNKLKRNEETKKLERIHDRVGIFHMFLQDSSEDGPFPVALVEFPDGEVENVPTELIRFLKPTAPETIDT